MNTHNTKTRKTRKRNYELVATIDLTEDGSPTQLEPSNNDVSPSPTVVVHLDDSVMEISLPSRSKPKVSKNRKSITIKKEKKSKPIPMPMPAAPLSPPRSRVGDCPICLMELGTNSGILSTKCGHVFCCVCLLQTLETTLKCPTCREDLKEPGSYHPIYLDVI